VDIGKFDVSKWNKNAFRDEIGVSKDTVLVGTVGRVNYNKGQEVLIKAIPHILKKTSNFKVVIVGDGEKLEACKTLAKDLGVEEFVHFTGFDIPNIQAALDIYTLASVKGEMTSAVSRKYRKTAEMDFCQSRTTAKILRTN